MNSGLNRILTQVAAKQQLSGLGVRLSDPPNPTVLGRHSLFHRTEAVSRFIHRPVSVIDPTAGGCYHPNISRTCS
jgi:hypothetical protein